MWLYNVLNKICYELYTSFCLLLSSFLLLRLLYTHYSTSLKIQMMIFMQKTVYEFQVQGNVKRLEVSFCNFVQKVIARNLVKMCSLFNMECFVFIDLTVISHPPLLLIKMSIVICMFDQKCVYMKHKDLFIKLKIISTGKKEGFTLPTLLSLSFFLSF